MKNYRSRCKIVVMISTLLTMLFAANTMEASTKIVFYALGQTAFYVEHDLEQGVARFEAKHPNIDVELIKGVNVNDYIDKVSVLLASGTQLDIMSPPPQWFLSTRNFSADLAPFMARDNIKISDFLPGTGDFFLHGNKILGLPLTAVLRGNGYNKRLFAEAGYQPPGNNAWTWAAVTDMAKKLTRMNSATGQPEIYGLDSGGRVRPLLLFPLAAQAGGLFFNRHVDPDKATLDSPASVTALRYYMNFYEQGYTSARAKFVNGNAAYTMDGYPMAQGSLEKSLGHNDVQFIPAAKGPVKGGFQIGVTGVQMVSTSQHQAEAWEFIKYLVTSEEEVAERYKVGQRQPSAWAKALPLFFRLANDFISFQAWVDVAADPDNERRMSFRSVEIEPLIERELTRVANREKPLLTVLEDLNRQVQALLDEAFRVQ